MSLRSAILHYSRKMIESGLRLEVFFDDQEVDHIGLRIQGYKCCCNYLVVHHQASGANEPSAD